VEKRFEDQVAFVTGAGSGIGRMTALLLAREGARVGCSDINEKGLAETVTSIEKEGGHALSIPCDVSDSASATAAVLRCAEELGGLQVLCNVAGVLRFQHTEETSDADWDQVLGVNLNGTFYTSRAALPHLLLNRRSAIVNVASLAGLIGQAYTAAYCVSKAGVVSLTKVMAVEYVKRGLRVNCVCPGGVATPLIANFDPPEGADLELMSRLSLVTKMTRPEEVADAIAYLASAAARSVNGVSLPLDFGVHAA
jgi:meso-butanediol dehydrogenase/(S,S)-butanediol dehydrogenase/diacetyl reductase